MDRDAKKVYNPTIYPKRERVVMKNWTVFSVLVLVAGLFCRGTAGAQSQGDLTGKMENLGIPLAQRYKNEAYGASGAYARNALRWRGEACAADGDEIVSFAGEHFAALDAIFAAYAP